MNWKKNLFTTLSVIAITVPTLVYLNISLQPIKDISYQASLALPLKTISQLSLSQNRIPAASCSPSVRGFNVVIEANEVAYLDESANIDTLTIRGQLHCDASRAQNVIELKVKTIILEGGTFQCGTSANPYNKKLIISLKNSGLDPKVNPGQRGIIVESGGKINLTGNRKNSGWYKINDTLNAGEQTLTVAYGALADANASSLRGAQPMMPTIPWSVGDQIVVGPTGYNYAEAEKFTITAVNGNQITLDHPALYTHWGENQTIHSRVLGIFNLDERAEVANLNRNILIRPDESTALIDEGILPTSQIGGHIMVHLGGQAYIDSIELSRMGQAGVMGRYPFHWHWAADVNGQYIKNSSIHNSFQRCVTVHRTHSALIQNNVCYNFKGHGYFLEDGNEINNKIIGNLAMKAIAPSTAKLLLASDDVRIGYSESQGRFPSVSGFWISNPKNIVKHNSVSGSIGTGFWMAFDDVVKDTNGVVIAQPQKEFTLEFNYNTAHAAKVGITWDGAPGWENANNPNNPDDIKPFMAHYEPLNVPTFYGNKAYKNYQTGIYFRGDSVIFKNSIIADNGVNFWVSYNAIVRDSVFIGRTDNTSSGIDHDFYAIFNDRMRKTGMLLYDGPFEIHHSDFIDFSTSPESYNVNGNNKNTTVIPFIATGGTNKFINVTSDLYFAPEPYNRMHLESETERQYAAFLLGNSTVRDLDGSLAGTAGSPKVLVGKRSLGITNYSGCTDGGTTFAQFKICPANYTEGSFNFMRWDSWPGAWSTPFITRRSDGALNFEKNEWSMFPSQFANNNVFALVPNQNFTYEILPYYQYETDRAYNVKPTFDSNFETRNVNVPVVKMVAYGNNCKLEDGAIQVTSLNALKAQTATSYFTQGKDFYVRVFPHNKWTPIKTDPQVIADAYTSMPTRFHLKCDPGFLAKEVLGNISSVAKGSTQTTINGWACNYTHATSIKVKLYVVGPAITQRSISSSGLPTPSMNTVTYLGETNANLSSDPKVAFDCGKLSASGRNFTFTVPNIDLSPYTNHKIYVKAISNTGGADMYIKGSGNFWAIPRVPTNQIPL